MPASGIERRATQFIAQRLVLTPLPFRPDIAIHIATPQSGLVGWLASEGLEDRAPYWAYAWGGGAALALYVRDNPHSVSGKTVLDFGAGSGLVGIAAAKAGADRVWALDTDPVAPAALALNAAANDVNLHLCTEAVPEVDLVLAGDVFYDPDVIAQTLPLLAGFRDRGATVLIGDPFRRDLPQDQLDLVAEYAVPDMGGREPVRAGVFALRP